MHDSPPKLRKKSFEFTPEKLNMSKIEELAELEDQSNSSPFFRKGISSNCHSNC